MEIDKKHVLLTGASGGIGQALALALAAKGARLTLIGRRAEPLETLCTGLSGEGHRVLTLDLNDMAARAELAQKLGEQPLDILINCAGSNQLGWLSDQTEYEIEQQLRINLLVPMLLTRQLLNRLNPKQALIVNIGSSFGAIGYPGYTAYCAAKFGLRGFSEALRRELSNTSTKVIYIAPRATDTALNSESVRAMNQILGNRMDSPETVAAVVLRSIARERTETYIGWPERLFVLINKLNSAPVTRAIRGQLEIIRRYAIEARSER
ncbi:Short-chain dehydrogenase/reductase SDR [Marinobacterium lacunae]|uniref:Short-chain dehydrogenase/reductase SDR n=1 Tax=Marinobacterium lacunae TaxID=1232683 RepID=A0A081FUB7_9GAMM|nr:SDR family oxidoreductase [Marinobacterium lacunae]KEA62122.1 Short-chain dehydrogenase/reductase SDR [Marinobacterium lacunae]